MFYIDEAITCNEWITLPGTYESYRDAHKAVQVMADVNPERFFDICEVEGNE